MPGIIGKLAEVVTDKREIGFLKTDALDQGNFFNGFVVENITTKAVNSIGGKNKDATPPEYFNGFLNLPVTRCFGVNFEQHAGICFDCGAKILIF
jgi:hypothetical protein